MVDAQYICCINDATFVFLILNAKVLIIKVGYITSGKFGNFWKEENKKITEWLLISQNQLLYHIIKFFFRKERRVFQGYLWQGGADIENMLLTVSSRLRAPSKWTGLDCCVLYWDSALMAGTGCIRSGFWSKNSQTRDLSWCKRMSRARPIPSFEDVLENEVTGLLTQKESIKRSYEVR